MFVFDGSGGSSSQFFQSTTDGCPTVPQTRCLLGNWPAYATHNFQMTFELHAHFACRRGQPFTFVGDDDVWVFSNCSLVLDLGRIYH